MKLLWLCNVVPGKVKEAVSGGAPPAADCGPTAALEGLRDGRPEYPHSLPRRRRRGKVNERRSTLLLFRGTAPCVLDGAGNAVSWELDTFQPDVIHVWGREYGHPAMVNAAEKAGLLDSLAVSIQGLCSVYAGHYAEGVPSRFSGAAPSVMLSGGTIS